MKKIISCIILISTSFYTHAQNVGIANNNPTERLSVNGSLLSTASYSTSTGIPDAQHTHSILPGRADSILVITDSVYRILDPGGNGNYLPNLPQSAIGLYDSSGNASSAVSGALELTFEMINLGTGDSVFVVNGLNSTVLLRGGNNMNSSTPLKYTGNYLIIYFASNADASVGQGFSAIVRRLYQQPNASSNGTNNYGNSALYFNANNGSFKAGIGNSNTAGFGSIALGVYNNATGANSIAIGNSSLASGVSDVAIGGGKAYGGSSVAIGGNANSNATNSQAFGYQARANGNYASALTPYSIATGTYSTAIGYNSRSLGVNSVALTGGKTDIIGYNTTAIGFNATAAKDYSVAIGRNATANGVSAMAIGEGSQTNGDYGIALGRNAHADVSGAFALGTGSIAGGSNCITIGSGQSYGGYTTAIGQSAAAGGSATVAMGYFASSNGTHAIAIGDNVSSTGNASLATGYKTTASGNYSTAMGNYVSTSGYEGAFTIGDNSTTTVMNTFVANGYRARFAGGYRLFTNAAANIGSFLNAGANSWAALSDVRLKENFLPVNGEDFLRKISLMPLTTWNYKSQDVKNFRHYGPMAQDFYKAFGHDELGEIGCDTLINQQDFLGVSLIAIQALEKRTQKIELLEQKIEALLNANKKLEEQLKELMQAKKHKP